MPPSAKAPLPGSGLSARAQVVISLKKWRRHADHGWLHDVRYWTHQFRHATDVWFEHQGPTFVANRGLCRVEDGYWIKRSLYSRLLWIDNYFGPRKQVSIGQTEVLSASKQAHRLPSGRLFMRPWRVGDFAVALHVYCGNDVIDDLVEEATYCLDGSTYQIGRGVWTDVQRCYLPTLFPFDVNLVFTLRNFDAGAEEISCSYVLFSLDDDRRDRLILQPVVQYPFDKCSTVIVERGRVRVERNRRSCIY